jgi:hypothetical protein
METKSTPLEPIDISELSRSSSKKKMYTRQLLTVCFSVCVFFCIEKSRFDLDSYCACFWLPRWSGEQRTEGIASQSDLGVQ